MTMDYSEFLAEVKVLRSKATYEGYKAALKHFPNPTKENIMKYIENPKFSSSTKKRTPPYSRNCPQMVQ